MRAALTYCDKFYFPGLELLAQALRLLPVRYPLYVGDIGMSDKQRAWLDASGIPHKPMVCPDAGNLRHRDYLLWCKPYAFELWDHLDEVVWIDCDAVPIRDITPLFDMLADGPVFTFMTNGVGLGNHPDLYVRRPVPMVKGETLNAGIFALSLKNHADTYRLWRDLVTDALSDESLANLICWHDQGALIWTMQKQQLQHRVQGPEWNCPPLRIEGKRKRYPRDIKSLVAGLQEDQPKARIVHYVADPKLWKLFN